MTPSPRTSRGLVALAVYCLVTGASLLLLLQFCERCGQDNAYLGEALLALLLALLGVLFGLAWLIGGRRGGRGGLVAGLVPAAAIGAAVLVLGSGRALVPPTLSGLTLLLLAVGGAAAVSRAVREP